MKNGMENGLVTRAMPERESRPARARAVALARISERLAASPWVQRLARLGYAAEGLLYVIVGGTAALAAMDVGGRVRGTRGALDLISATSSARSKISPSGRGF